MATISSLMKSVSSKSAPYKQTPTVVPPLYSNAMAQSYGKTSQVAPATAPQQKTSDVLAFKQAPGMSLNTSGYSPNVSSAINTTQAGISQTLNAPMQSTSNTIVRPDGTAYQIQGGQSVNVPQALTSDYLSGDSNFSSFQTPQPSGVTESLVASTAPSIQSLQQTTTPTPVQQPSALEQRIAGMDGGQFYTSKVTALEDEQFDLRNRLDEAYQKLGTKGQRLEELRQSAGVPSLMEDLQTINKQIAAKSAQYSQALLDNQSRPGLITNIQGRESLIKRQQAVEIGAMTAMAEAMQGNYDLARQYIADTINVEFEDAEANIKNVLAQLDINRENMTAAEKKEAKALAYQMQAEQQSIQDAKEQKQSIYDIAIAAAQNGADAATLNKITSSTDIASALNASGGFLSAQSVGGLDIMDQLKIAEAGYTVDANGNLVRAGTTGAVGADGKPITAEQAEQAQSALGLVDKILNSNWKMAVGTSSLIPAIPGTETSNVVNYIDSLKSLLTLQNMGYLKGTMSDNDIKFITAASSALNRNMTEDAFKETLGEIKQKFQKVLGGGQTTQQFVDTPDIVNRVTAKINSLDNTSKQLFNGLLAEGIPYSFIDAYGNEGGPIVEIYKAVNGNPQDFIDTVKAQYQQLGFNNVGGDTKTASIGKLSEKYESSGNPGAIGWDSTGGTSYGAWQLAHNNALSYVNQSEFAKEFAGLAFNSQAFINKWKEIAQRSPEQFKESQRKYIEKTHYFPQAQKVAAAGVNLSQRSAALRDVVWSTAVQHGPNTRVITDAIKKVGPNASDADLIKAIYERRWSGGAEFSGSTQAVKNSVYKRFQSELQGALAMLNNNNIA